MITKLRSIVILLFFITQQQERKRNVTQKKNCNGCKTKKMQIVNYKFAIKMLMECFNL